MKGDESTSVPRRFEPPRAVDWAGGWVRAIDQTQLPGCVRYIELGTAEEVREAIRGMKIRGAPAIGVAAALGVALAARSCPDSNVRAEALSAAERLRGARPTAVNLAWAVERMKKVIETGGREGGDSLREKLLSEAISIMEEDRELCRRIGENGAALLKDGWTVLTHCNAGALA
ncbi:MAG: S-methyl-5-thioribose-1-phosphate isomerase, partial [Candidatus Eiseniibacteriota bacterium]